MTALAEACTDLIAWLPHAHALIAEPDTQPTIGRTQPTSTPPWNSEAANVLFTIHAELRDLEQELRQEVTGRPAHQCRRPGWSDTNTARSIEAIRNLSEAAGTTTQTTRTLEEAITAIRQLPAIDLEDRWRRIPAPCPHCKRHMLRACLRNGKVACLGCARHGQMQPGMVSDGYIEWEDGTIT